MLSIVPPTPDFLAHAPAWPWVGYAAPGCCNVSPGDLIVSAWGPDASPSQSFRAQGTVAPGSQHTPVVLACPRAREAERWVPAVAAAAAVQLGHPPPEPSAASLASAFPDEGAGKVSEAPLVAPSPGVHPLGTATTLLLPAGTATGGVESPAPLLVAAGFHFCSLGGNWHEVPPGELPPKARPHRGRCCWPRPQPWPVTAAASHRGW